MANANFGPDLIAEFRALTQSERPEDMVRVPDLGRALKDAGFEHESRLCFDLVAGWIRRFADEDNAYGAILFEEKAYSAFVKPIEREDHYRACFDAWISHLVSMGRQARTPITGARDSRKVCFVVHSASLLGHTEVMLTVLKAWNDCGLPGERYIAALSGRPEAAFADRLAASGTTFIGAEQAGKALRVDHAVLALRTRLAELGVGTVVWVSQPTIAGYALSMGLAPRQVLWSLKFHPIHLSDVDVHLCGGHDHETDRAYHGRPWTVSPFPLTLDSLPVEAAAVRAIRATFAPGAVLLGVLAREEKITSPAYLSAIGTILQRNPNAHFLWTGRTAPPSVTGAFDASGVADRCHFIGWVDTNLYGAAFDIFLETFPFGCAITGFQAMSHGTPLLSMNLVDTVFGYQLKGGLNDALTPAVLEQQPILTAADPAHYLALAQRLINDVSYRRVVGAREQAYVQSERDALAPRARRLWRNMTGVSR